MKKYFITYGNKNYEESKNRIIQEAKKLNLFDCIIPYGPENLSKTITDSPLFSYSKGGGYWIWKSYIIEETLKLMNDGDILVYADSGCQLFPSNMWNKYFNYLIKYSILVFKINCLNYQYIKKKVIDDFKRSNGKYWHYSYQVAGGIIFLKKDKHSIKFIQDWRLNCKTEYICDILPQEKMNENKSFIDHRHDQAVLTALVYKYKSNLPIKMVWNDFEAKRTGQAIFAARISDKNKRSNDKERHIKLFFRKYMVLPIRNTKQFIWQIINLLSQNH